MTSAVLTSRSAEDILQIDTKGYWDHTHTPSQLKVGDIVFLTVSQKLRKVHNVARMGIVNSISKAPKEQWTSNRLGNAQTYASRIGLIVVTSSPTDAVDELLSSVGKKQNTSGIMYIDSIKRYSK
jgi:hypothetical protein